jgi:predicted enzyme related to lactoylglutathione lyase
VTDVRLAALEIRVTDISRARRFYETLFGWRLPDHTIAPTSASRIETLFTDDPAAPGVRLLFGADDPAAALARFRDLGGKTNRPDMRDDQGVPVGFRPISRTRTAPKGFVPRGEVGVVIVGAADAAKAMKLYGALCGWTFHHIGRDDRWWMDDGPVGFFHASLMNIDFETPLERGSGDRDIAYFYAVPDLDEALETVRRLGGRTLEPAMMGPNPICGCYDDQGTRFGLCVIPG